jgi:hypothetical protein
LVTATELATFCLFVCCSDNAASSREEDEEYEDEMSTASRA